MNSKVSSKPVSTAPRASHANFIEALKSIGGQTASSISHDVVGGVGRDFLQSLTGSRPSVTSEAGRSQRNEWDSSPEDKLRAEMARLERHREVTATKLFDRKEEETKTKIKVIQEELKVLAAELGKMDKQLAKAIEEEVVSPGVYHVNFFEKLRRLVIILRKQVIESSVWLETANQRKAAQSGYWGNVSKSGTRYMLSQERTLATQAG